MMENIRRVANRRKSFVYSYTRLGDTRDDSEMYIIHLRRIEDANYMARG